MDGALEVVDCEIRVNGAGLLLENFRMPLVHPFVSYETTEARIWEAFVIAEHDRFQRRKSHIIIPPEIAQSINDGILELDSLSPLTKQVRLNQEQFRIIMTGVRDLVVIEVVHKEAKGICVLFA